jgi:hypothetical protein
VTRLTFVCAAATTTEHDRAQGLELPKLLLEVNILARTGFFVGTFSSNSEPHTDPACLTESSSWIAVSRLVASLMMAMGRYDIWNHISSLDEAW